MRYFKLTLKFVSYILARIVGKGGVSGALLNDLSEALERMSLRKKCPYP